jgi:6,7-dimethyl-8-ribityllumazine synthase
MPLNEMRIGVVVSKWNAFVTDPLRDGALETLRMYGLSEQDVVLAECPGAFEIPTVAKALLEIGSIDGVVALGAVIRGDTPHFEYVCEAVSSGLGRLGLDTGKPVIFGVLTTDTIEQAKERAGGPMGNKGSEAAAACVEMVTLLRRIRSLTFENGSTKS